jgi:hypothetical protein
LRGAELTLDRLGDHGTYVVEPGQRPGVIDDGTWGGRQRRTGAGFGRGQSCRAAHDDAAVAPRAAAEGHEEQFVVGNRCRAKAVRAYRRGPGHDGARSAVLARRGQVVDLLHRRVGAVHAGREALPCAAAHPAAHHVEREALRLGLGKRHDAGQRGEIKQRCDLVEPGG